VCAETGACDEDEETCDDVGGACAEDDPSILFNPDDCVGTAESAEEAEDSPAVATAGDLIVKKSTVFERAVAKAACFFPLA
jgi:hypothetical protein